MFWRLLSSSHIFVGAIAVVMILVCIIFCVYYFSCRTKVVQSIIYFLICTQSRYELPYLLRIEVLTFHCNVFFVEKCEDSRVSIRICAKWTSDYSNSAQCWDWLVRCCFCCPCCCCVVVVVVVVVIIVVTVVAIVVVLVLFFSFFIYCFFILFFIFYLLFIFLFWFYYYFFFPVWVFKKTIFKGKFFYIIFWNYNKRENVDTGIVRNYIYIFKSSSNQGLCRLTGSFINWRVGRGTSSSSCWAKSGSIY